MKQMTTTRLPVARNPTALGKMTEAESVTMEEKQTNTIQFDVGVGNRWKMRLNVAKQSKERFWWLGFESRPSMSLSERS